MKVVLTSILIVALVLAGFAFVAVPRGTATLAFAAQATAEPNATISAVQCPPGVSMAPVTRTTETVTTPETAMPETTGTPTVDLTGTPETGQTGTPRVDLTGTPEADQTGTPDADQTGTPDADQTGTPDVDQTGTPDADQTGAPDADETETPDADQTGTPDAATTGTATLAADTTETATAGVTTTETALPDVTGTPSADQTETPAPSTEGFVGSWLVRVTPLDEARGELTLMTFSNDGLVITAQEAAVVPEQAGAPANLLSRSAGHGAWTSSSPGMAEATFVYLVNDDRGCSYGTIRVEATLTLSDDGQSFSGEVFSTAVDLTGQEAATGTRTVTGQRIVVTP